MKYFFFFLGLFLIASCYSQNTYPWPSSGNVGIGTSNPGARLQLNSGSGKISIGEVNWQSSAALGYSIGYFGFNMQNTNQGSWLLNTDGVSSGGSGFFADIFGQMKFVSVPPTSGDQSLTNTDLNSKVIFTLNPGGVLTTGRANVNNGAQRISLNRVPWQAGASLGYSSSYLGFNVEDDGSTGWNVISDGANNGGVALLGSIFGELRFVNLASSGGSNRTVQASEMNNSVSFKVGPGYVQAPGVMQIGTTALPSGYKLSVDGKIITEELTVKLKTSWPDYVFDSSYSLPSLDSVQLYINQNKHLPEVPSAKEIESNGVNVGEMNMLLLKKVEELTLYVIELKKENQSARENNEQLSATLSHLIHEVEILKYKHK